MSNLKAASFMLAMSALAMPGMGFSFPRPKRRYSDNSASAAGKGLSSQERKALKQQRKETAASR